MEPFVDYCKNYIKENLEDYVGNEYYLCDLSLIITESPNCDGSLTYSSEDARDYLREWYYDAGRYWEYEKMNFGEHMHNPFDNPEAYMVCMVIEGVRSLIDRAISDLGMDDKWNQKVKLTKSLAKRILKAVEENDEDELF